MKNHLLSVTKIYDKNFNCDLSGYINGMTKTNSDTLLKLSEDERISKELFELVMSMKYDKEEVEKL